MRRISLVSMTIESFKSFHGPETINFSQASGLKFLTGRNELEPALGENGAGKSSMWDALFWCLYGTSALGDRSSDVRTWGHKRPRVSVLLNVEGEEGIITRRGSPDRLEWHWASAPDLEQISQDELDHMLGLSKARFAQAVVFGQRAPFFLDLTIPARGALLDEALDLTVWNRAADLALDQARIQEHNLTNAQQMLARAEGGLDALPSIDSLLALEREFAMRTERDVTEALTEAEEHAEQLEAWTATLASLRAEYANLPEPSTEKVKATRAELRAAREKIVSIKAGLATEERALKVFADGKPTCSVCRQAISPEHAKAQLHTFECESMDKGIECDELAELVSKLEARLERAELNASIVVERRSRAQEEGAAAAARVSSGKKHQDNLDAQVKRAMAAAETNPHTQAIADARQKRDTLEASILTHEATIESIEGKMQTLAYWKTGFKRVRLFIVRRILAHLELDVANAASLLGLSGWTIKFATETEGKTGSIKAGVQIVVSSPDAPAGWTLWSGGEGQRIRLAVEMGLASLIQRLSGVSYDFEVWDEPSGFLSDKGIDDLLECLRYRAETTGKSIWLTDHRTYSYPFDETWTVVKDGKRGSYIETDKEIEQ